MESEPRGRKQDLCGRGFKPIGFSGAVFRDDVVSFGRDYGHVSDSNGAAYDAKADVKPLAPDVSDAVPDIVFQNPGENRSEADSQTRPSTSDAEKTVEDQAEVGTDGQKERVEVGEDLGNPNVVLFEIDDPDLEESTASPLVENEELNVSSREAGGSILETTTEWLGICPRNTSAKDHVCILFGCSVPVILHPMGEDAYKLVAEVYVYGVISGDVIKNMDEEELERRNKVFNIR
ncbi:hypothetical protein P170DRAFT_424064 [Aspergillus steynii IBT 23096]|uniref:Uncharacterized protein n=1 Tax=Aspergillus steynii IBT 23096 TaxID=1392250 RepID=A0A2I2GKC8_9EURO|nr:uncharacterized protein P170DRAFT_424064 [Aspergillus steynii IBT 23096]PLB53307.1 hypothetical protein P170DRAFT_424064 [Aspergillus steynii IBT 23096]